MFNRNFKYVLALVLYFLLSPSAVSAMTCEEAQPGYGDFTGEQSACLDDYDECVADPYDYSLGDCGSICDEQYPGRINWITDSGCIGKTHENVFNYVYGEFGEASSEKLANYCDCINQCVQENREPYDVEERCVTPLKRCCKDIAQSYDSSSVSNGQNSTEDLEADDENEEKYFTVFSIGGEKLVDVMRSGSSEEVPLSVGQKINEGDTLLVGYHTTVNLTRNDYAYLFVPELSVLEFTEVTFGSQLTQVQINLHKGSMTSKFQPERGLRAKWEIKAPVGTVGVRGTVFRVDYSDVSGILSAVAYEHDIYLKDEANDQTYDVSEGNAIRFDGLEVTEVSGIPEDMKLSEGFAEFLATEGDNLFGYETISEPENTLSGPTLLILSSVSCVMVLVLVAVLIILIKKKKKLLIVLSLLALVCFGICSFSSGALYLFRYLDDKAQESLTDNDSDDATDDSGNLDNANENDSNDKDLTEEIVSGEIINQQNLYSFNIGDLSEKLVEREDDSLTYVYCYPDPEKIAYDYDVCSDGEVEIFRITKVVESVYQESLEPDSLVNLELLGTTSTGNYYVMEMPNGMFPEELLPITDHTDKVADSFEVIE